MAKKYIRLCMCMCWFACVCEREKASLQGSVKGSNEKNKWDHSVHDEVDK